MFVNTPFYKEDCRPVLIKNLYHLKRYTTQKLLNVQVRVGTSEVFGAAEKLKHHGTVDRHPGSDRSKTAPAYYRENVDLC